MEHRVPEPPKYLTPKIAKSVWCAMALILVVEIVCVVIRSY